MSHYSVKQGRLLSIFVLPRRKTMNTVSPNEPVYTILDPRGWEPKVEYQGLSPRLATLDNKKLMVINLHGGNEEVMEALALDLQAEVPGCHVEYYPVKGRWANLEDEDWEKMLTADAAILGHNY
jgi:hypothetical protein